MPNILVRPPCMFIEVGWFNGALSVWTKLCVMCEEKCFCLCNCVGGQTDSGKWKTYCQEIMREKWWIGVGTVPTAVKLHVTFTGNHDKYNNTVIYCACQNVKCSMLGSSTGALTIWPCAQNEGVSVNNNRCGVWPYPMWLIFILRS